MINKIRTIRWLDSSIQEHQVDEHNFPEPTIITSIGYAVKETNEYIILARDDMGKDDYRGLICIPKIAILDPDGP